MYNPVTFSNLFGATFETLQRNMQVVGVYMAIMIPVGALSLMFEGGGGNTFGFSRGFMIDQALISQGAFPLLAVLGGFVIGVVVQYWMLAGMVRRTVSPGFDAFLPYVGIYILSAIGMMFGLILLIVPGVILAIRWLPILPIVIAREGPAMDSFGRSWGLTGNAAGAILGVGIVLILGLAALGSVAGVMGYALGGGGSFLSSVFASVAEQIGAALIAAFSVAAYDLLRDDSEELTEVFE